MLMGVLKINQQNDIFFYCFYIYYFDSFYFHNNNSETLLLQYTRLSSFTVSSFTALLIYIVHAKKITSTFTFYISFILLCVFKKYIKYGCEYFF